MKVRVKNGSPAPQGVENERGRTVYIRPGQEQTLSVASPRRLDQLPFLSYEIIESDVPEMPASLTAKVTKPGPLGRKARAPSKGPGTGARRRRKTARK